MSVSIEEVQGLVNDLGEKIDASASLLIVRSAPLGDGSPHIEIHDNRFDYVVSERGIEFSRKSTDSLDELLYWILHGVAVRMALDYELRNREHGFDFRRKYFSRMIFLLERINHAWGRRARFEVEEILKTSPYNDV